MPKLAYFPFYMDDFEHDTALFADDDLRFKYLRVLWAAYHMGNRLPNVDKDIARLAGIERTKGWRKKAALIMGRFVVCYDEESAFLWHKRVAEELAKMAGDNVIQFPVAAAARTEGEPAGREFPSLARAEFHTHTQSHIEDSEFARQDLPIGGNQRPLVSAATLAQARQRYPGWDVEEVLERFRVWVGKGGREEPRHVDRAFMGFFKRHVERNTR